MKAKELLEGKDKAHLVKVALVLLEKLGMNTEGESTEYEKCLIAHAGQCGDCDESTGEFTPC